MQCRFYLFVLFVVLYVKADIDQTSITTGSYSTTGTATVSSFIQLTTPSTGQAGIALYSAQQTIANGFATTFDYNSNTCSSPGADGFTFLVSPNLTIIDSLSSGNALAIAGSANVAVVAFDLYNDKISVCVTNALTPLSWASSCVFTSIGTELRCSGSHTVHIVLIPPSSWQVWLDGTLKGNFTKDVTNTLTAVNNMTYVGFTGSTGPSLSMRQRVTAWSFSSSGSCSSSNGGCSLEATCTVVNGFVQCTCNEGYTGDGYSCTINSPPVDVPIAQPVEVPIATPLSEPVTVPITPVAVPITSPQANPVTIPIAPPVTHPVSVPVSVPTTIPTIVPILECFDDLQNGTFIAYFGYDNTMGEQIVLPIGLMNTFGNPSFIGQPTTFVAGRSSYFPNAAFGYLWSGKTLIWTLTSFRLTLDTSDTSRKCPSFARFTLTFYTERELYEQEVNSISAGVANALDISRERVRVLSIKYTLVSRKRDLSVAELEMEIAGANSTQIDEPNAAESVQSLVEIAQNATALTQALDPNATSNIQYIGVKSSPTGVEQSGIAVPPVTTSGSPRSLINVSSSTEKQMVVSQLWHFLLLFIMVSVTVHHRL